MSRLLRHEASEYGLAMDPEGYVLMTDLLTAMRRTMSRISPEMIAAVVAHSDPHKQRLCIVGDTIRANYGHSVADRVRYPAIRPPAWLYHGTSQAALNPIRCNGLLPMLRQYVHLAEDPVLAHQIGSRHGQPVVLSIAAAEAYGAGIVFFSANDGVWLVSALPAAFLVFAREVDSSTHFQQCVPSGRVSE